MSLLLVEQRITGMALVFSVALISRQTSKPLLPGNTTSRTMTSGWFPSSFSSPSSPLVATVTLIPRFLQKSVIIVRSVMESSINKMVPIGGYLSRLKIQKNSERQLLKSMM